MHNPSFHLLPWKTQSGLIVQKSYPFRYGSTIDGSKGPPVIILLMRFPCDGLDPSCDVVVSGPLSTLIQTNEKEGDNNQEVAGKIFPPLSHITSCVLVLSLCPEL